MNKDPQFIVIDLFCGAGGTSTGFSRAVDQYGNRIAYIAACVNHDPIALASHQANHPEVYHFDEDITLMYGKVWRSTWTKPMVFWSDAFMKLKRIVDLYKAFYPGAKIILWASLECTNFSNAKGGQPRDADSRTLADHLKYYIAGLKPDYVQIENVVEFMAWGPLDENGKPVSRDKGKDWIRWRKYLCKEFNLVDVWNTMNSANYGSYTARNRLFGCFAPQHLPIVWPTPDYAKKPKAHQKKWKAVKDVLELEDKGESIFNRKKPLVDATLNKILTGLIKFVAAGDTQFLFHQYKSGRYSSLDRPAPTITTVNKIALMDMEFLYQYYGNSTETSLYQPLPTISTKDRFGLVKAEAIIENPSHGANYHSIEVPCPVIVARQDKAPLRLIQVLQGDVQIPIYKEDTEPMIKIKYFMAYYGLKDIRMRMLKVPELLRIQGFPSNYTLLGSQADQKKFIGNSVEPNVVTRWVKVLHEELQKTS